MRFYRCHLHGGILGGKIWSENVWGLTLKPGESGLFYCEAGHYVKVRASPVYEAIVNALTVFETEVKEFYH